MQGIKANWRHFAPETFSFDVENTGEKDMIAVLNENAFPGWSASRKSNNETYNLDLIDNNLSLLAVRLPKGQHSVTFKYYREVFKTANILAAMGGGLFLLFIIIHYGINQRVFSLCRNKKQQE